MQRLKSQKAGVSKKKKKYILHYGDFAIRENEKLYSNQALKGWILEKRGVSFSRFVKENPQKLEYHIDLIDVEKTGTQDNIKKGQQISQKQFEGNNKIHEEAGWHFVTRSSYVCVYSSLSNQVKDFQEELSQQSNIYQRLLRKQLGSLLRGVLIFLVYTIMLLINIRSMSFGYRAVIPSLKLIFIEHTATMLLVVLFIFHLFFQDLYGSYRMFLLIHTQKYKKSNNIKSEQHHSSYEVLSIIRVIKVIIFSIFIVLAITENIRATKYDMPFVSDGPYMTLEDIGIIGERIEVPISKNNKSSVEINYSVLTTCWNTREYIISHSRHYWIYQSIYELKNESLVPKLISMLIESKKMDSRELITPIISEEFDYACRIGDGLHFIVAKDNRVHYINLLGDLSNEQYEIRTRLLALALKNFR